jgi:N-acetylmuramoyl-L-alanine amidase
MELDREAAAEKKQKRSRARKPPTRRKVARQSAPKDADSHIDDQADNSKIDGTKRIPKAKQLRRKPPKPHSGHLPRVTGIRHWSTPDYTRVAIDLESDIKFGSQRIANPDRIFFDLRGTKLASTLVGKSFDVDDGFLKKIRVAQFQPGRTRVVLEVDNLSDYEAFLLPNPYRLIVDIHGKDNHGKDNTEDAWHALREFKDAETETADVEAPPKAGSKAEVLTMFPNPIRRRMLRRCCQG